MIEHVRDAPEAPHAADRAPCSASQRAVHERAAVALARSLRAASRKLLSLRCGAILLVVGGVAAACWLTWSYQQSDRVDLHLVVQPESLDLGEVWEEDRFVWMLTVTNPHKHDVVIERFVTTCACVAVAPSSLAIPASVASTLIFGVH